MAEALLKVPLLKVEGLQAWYGESHILHGVGFEIGRGELVTLLGRNGAGKTTTLKSVMGIVEKRSGSVSFEGRQTVGHPSDQIARLGPQVIDNGIIPGAFGEQRACKFGPRPHGLQRIGLVIVG